LHARIALLLESLPERPSRLGEIAYHWWKARNRECAVAANEAAGDAAMNLHAYGDAATFYERALALAADPEVQSRLCARAGGAASVQGDQPGAIGFYERALALELEAKRFWSASEIVRRIAGRLVYAGRDAEARARLEAFLRAYRAQLSDVDALLVEGWPMLIDLGGGGVRAWRERLVRSGARAAEGSKDAWGLLLLEVNANAALGDVAAWRASLDRLRPFALTGSAADRAFSLLAFGLSAAYDGSDAAFARLSLRETHEFCERNGLESFQKYVYACDAFDRYLHGDVRGAQGAAHLALADPDDANQRTNMAVVGPLIGRECDDADLLALANDDALLGALEREDCPNSTALAAAGVALRFRALARDDEAARVLERALEALQTLFGAQLLLPLAARFVTTSRARERIEELCDALYDDDRSGQATCAMVRAVFAARDRAPERVDLAQRAAQWYAALDWPLLQAQALELGGDSAAARELYMRCGSPRQVRRLTRGDTTVPAADALPALPALSLRERQVAAAVAAGLGNVEIAARLGVSVKTIESHLSRIYARLGLRSRVHLATYMANEARVKA
jgi:DNA-binding NarL/FixJ family response regulator